MSHADDAYFVVDTDYIDPTTTLSDIKMQKILIDLWVSFATNRSVYIYSMVSIKIIYKNTLLYY